MAEERIIHVDQGGGCLRLGGALTALIGLMLLGGTAWDRGGGDPFWLWGAGILGALTLVAGLALMVLRAGLTVDADAGQVIRWRRLVVPITEERQLMTDFTTVYLLRERVRQQAPVRTLYHVRLGGDGGELTVTALALHDDARQLGLRLAELGGWALAERPFEQHRPG